MKAPYKEKECERENNKIFRIEKGFMHIVNVRYKQTISKNVIEYFRCMTGGCPNLRKCKRDKTRDTELYRKWV